MSVVIPTHNRPHLLAGAVESVLNQTYPGRIECLVVNDQQAPSPPSVRTARDRELRVLANDRSPGPAGARNEGALAARGEFLAFCDDDDEWLPDKVRLQVEALRGHESAAAITCGILLEVGGRTIKRTPRRDRITLEDLLRSRMVQEIHTSTLLLRRDALAGDIGLFEESIPGSYGEEYDLLRRATLFGPIIVLRQPLVRVSWNESYFVYGWNTIIDGLKYHLERWPELASNRANAARLYGRIAFAHAALGQSQEAREWARRSLRASWRQPRGYLALLVAHRLVSAGILVRLAQVFGRGV